MFSLTVYQWWQLRKKQTTTEIRHQTLEMKEPLHLILYRVNEFRMSLAFRIYCYLQKIFNTSYKFRDYKKNLLKLIVYW